MRTNFTALEDRPIWGAAICLQTKWREPHTAPAWQSAVLRSPGVDRWQGDDKSARMHTTLKKQQQGEARHMSACAGVRGGQDF
jgi:hypothetical protein